MPRYLTAVDIHLMPGNYDGERVEDDISAGALYDRGVLIPALGMRGAYGEDYGASFGDFVRARFPDLIAPTSRSDSSQTLPALSDDPIP